MGNRLSALGVGPYTYNASNELTSIGKTTFTYDANGKTPSRVSPSGTTSYTWDFENRLTSITLPNGSVEHFKYDPFGRRIFIGTTGGAEFWSKQVSMVERSALRGRGSMAGVGIKYSPRRVAQRSSR